jgi:mannose-6-phosphate isomerase-like protein (cupin superfamily)
VSDGEKLAAALSDALTGAAARRVPKPWGYEHIWAETDRYAGKLIAIETGQRLSLQVHERKLESLYVLSGVLRLHLEDAAGEMRHVDLRPGDHAHIPVGRRHRFEALERVELIEVSTPELDDVIRLEDDFGREGTSAP